MTAWNPRANELFLKALELRSAGERQEYLDGACAGDAGLRAEVESLLEASARAGSFLGSPAPAPPRVAAVEEPPHAERPGTVIGPYKLLEQIGEGGMGRVFVAEQQHPVRRKVALKVLKPGMDSGRVIARFEAERQALALMDHPNIAKVLDGGATPSGRPYFVMELVKGLPITQFCDENRLTARERLELFVLVCQAVQHAHTKGIIHRDIKPSNVLVAPCDGNPVPKVIDFGIAKATGQQLTDKTLVTGFGAIVGTLEYMSPEQTEPNNPDIDTRSDIYSLGVLLYELLTGGPPFSRQELEKRGVLEMLRVIREQEPSRPSTKLSTAEGLPTLAANRGTEPAKLTKEVRGELDWIVMKSLEKDRGRRYQTANGFALDLRRFLLGEFVEACPPSAWYRLRKFVRRHKGPVLAATLLFVMLIAGLAIALVSNWQVNQALAARNLALGQLEDEQEKTAQALVRETGLKNQATEALEQAELALYSYRVSLAQREWYANRVGRAEYLLDECPAPLRGWEWHYLKRMCHADLVTFRGHRRLVYSAEFSPDGKQVVSCGGDGTVRVWDAATGQEVRRLKGHASVVQRVVFSPDGRRLASAGSDGRIQLWDVATGEVVWTVRDQGRRFLRVAFSPDGRHLAAASGDTHFNIWDAGTGRVVRRVEARNGRVRWVTYSPDGTSLAWDEAPVSVVLGDSATGQERRRWNAATTGSLTCLAFSPDGRYLATGGHRLPLVLWDATSGEKRLTHASGIEVKDVAFSPDGKRLATAHFDQTVRLWSTVPDVEPRILRGHTAAVHSAAFDPAGRRVVSAAADDTVKVWSATDDQDVRIGSHRTMVGLYWMAVSPVGQRLALGGRGGAASVMFCDTAHGKELGTLDTGHSLMCRSAAFSPDGRRLATGGDEGTVRVWDVEQKRALVACQGHERPVNGLAFSPDGRLLASAGEDAKVILWDPATGTEARTLLHAGPVKGLSFSPDGRRLATCCERSPREERGAVRVWEVTTGRELLGLRGHDLVVTCVSFSPDGRQLASAATDKQVKLWDATTGAERGTLGGHASGVVALAYHPDGRRLAAGTVDGAVVIWDLARGREALTLQGGKQAIRAVAFLPDGKTLVAACEDGRVRFWDGTPLEEPPKEALK